MGPRSIGFRPVDMDYDGNRMRALVSFGDAHDPSLLDLKAAHTKRVIDTDPFDPFVQVSAVPNRREVAFLYIEGAGPSDRYASLGPSAVFKLESGGVGSCVHYLLQDGGERRHMALRCGFEPVASDTCEIDLELFGMEDARRHLLAKDPQAQAALTMFPEAEKLTRLSLTRRASASR